MQHLRIDELISAQSNNVKLVEALKLIQSRPTSRSLAAYDNYNYAELYQFRKAFFQEVDYTIVGSEPFPGEMLTPCRSRVALPDNIYQILTVMLTNYNLQQSPKYQPVQEIQLLCQIWLINLAGLGFQLKFLDQQWHSDT